MWYSNGKDTDIALWILLTTTALVAFAGAAAADGHAVAPVVFDGSATLEYNDITGLNSEATLNVTMQRALDNGLTASASVSVDLEANGGQALTAADYVLSLTSETSSLSYGDVDPVAAAAWSGVDGSTFGDFDEDSPFDAVLASSATFGATTASVSYGVDLTAQTFTGMQLGVTSTIAGASMALAYQDADHDGLDGDGLSEYEVGELLGVSVGTTLSGATVTLALLTDMDDTSFGVDVSYPVGAMTVGGYYSVNSAADDAWGVRADYDNSNGLTAGVLFESDDSWEVTGGYAANAITLAASFDSDDVFAVDATYDMGNGLTVIAGGDTDDNSYAGVTYALGEGASAYLNYASAAEVDPDEDLDEGTTVGISFTF